MNRITGAPNLVHIKTILVSVFDKADLTTFLSRIQNAAPTARVIASGGTYAEIKQHMGERLVDRLVRLSDFTGQPEMQGGLVKSLDYHIYAALLSETENEDHKRDLDRLGTPPIDMVITNLYPFEAVVADGSNDIEDARAHIDIGGPAMLRAAAKNFLRVAAVCDVGDYDAVAAELEEQSGALSLTTRACLAQKVFRVTSTYDNAIALYMEKAGGTVERRYL